MRFTTPLSLPAAPFSLTPTDGILFLGSCFADHIGQRTAQAFPAGQIEVNPFGTLYDERTIARAIALCSGIRALEADTYFEGRDQLWRNWWMAGEVARPTRGECEMAATHALERGRQMLGRARLLVVTLSTPRYYQLRNAPSLNVANCHKQPAADFAERCDTLAESLDRWHRLLANLLDAHPDLRVVLTVSPYRYLNYGLPASQVAKAQLILLADALCRQHERVHYFPAYEILLDELRDYRFYAPDMLHPSAQAIDYIGERFESWCFAPQLHAFATERRALIRDIEHRPLHPESQAYLQFRHKLDERVQEFRKIWGEAAI